MLNIKLRKKQDARASEETRASFDISKKKKRKRTRRFYSIIVYMIFESSFETRNSNAWRSAS